MQGIDFATTSIPGLLHLWRTNGLPKPAQFASTKKLAVRLIAYPVCLRAWAVSQPGRRDPGDADGKQHRIASLVGGCQLGHTGAASSE
jgi:hypothetical protein